MWRSDEPGQAVSGTAVSRAGRRAAGRLRAAWWGAGSRALRPAGQGRHHGDGDPGRGSYQFTARPALRIAERTEAVIRRQPGSLTTRATMFRQWVLAGLEAAERELGITPAAEPAQDSDSNP